MLIVAILWLYYLLFLFQEDLITECTDVMLENIV